MKVSIIIPTYNRCDYILSVIQTIQQQDYDLSMIEVIVADNESDDGTKELLLSLSCAFSLQVITVPKEYHFEAAHLRNEAAKVAAGDVFIFVDSDILLPKNFISSHLCYYRSTEDKISVIGSVYYMENRTYSKNIESIPLEEKLTLDPLECFYSSDTECGVGNPLVWMMYHAGNVSMTRKVFELVQGFDEWHTEWSIEDLDFGFQLQKQGIRIIYSKYAFGLHKWHENSGKNSNSIDTGFKYLIHKENEHPLICYAYADLQRRQYEQEHHITRTNIAKRKFFLTALQIMDPAFKVPDFTIAVYSPGHHKNLYSLLDQLENQYNGRFEVLIIDDSDCIEKDALLQIRNYRYPMRLFHVNWHKEKVDFLVNELKVRHFATDTASNGIEKLLIQIMKRDTEWYKSELNEQFETLVYYQAIGNCITLIHDEEMIGDTFISNLFRDLLNRTEKVN